MPNFDSQGIVNTLTNELALVNKWLKDNDLFMHKQNGVSVIWHWPQAGTFYFFLCSY